MLIDARGLGCPKPVMMAEESLSKIGEGIIEVLVDNEASVKNLTRFASKNGFYTENIKDGACWRVKIVKGYPCEIESHESEVRSKEPEDEKRNIMLIVASDVMGKDEDLGSVLMKGFFESMKVYKEVPHTIFFLNAGVKLTTVDNEIAPIIKEIEAMGVEIYSCGTCLKHYNLEAELKVGHRGASTQIIEGIKDFQKTVWIG